MAKNKNKQGVKPPLNGSTIPSKNRNMVNYRNVGAKSVCDPVCADSIASRTPFFVTTSGSGNASGHFAFAPLGINSLSTTNTIAALEPVHLPWLNSTGSNFLMYRVSRATLVVVGNVGSTASGQIAILSSVDFVDTALNTGSFGDYVVGGTSFAIADLANNNRRVPLRIDSSWKKITSRSTTVVGGVVVDNSSVDDLIFTSFSYAIQGAPSTTNVCTFYVEYDVEFKGVVSFGTQS